MDPVPAEGAVCTGFPADTYDRYVLGLLDRQERAVVDAQIEQQCPACLKGVQRSMNLWLVFANSLDPVEPAADFRARLVRIADLSKRILTVPKRNKRVREPAILISSLAVICLITAGLVIFTWIAARQTYSLESERSSNQLAKLEQQAAKNTVELSRQLEMNRELNQKLKSPGNMEVTLQTLRDQLSKAQAEAQLYKNSISRDSAQTKDNSTLVTALASPGVKLLTFKNAEGVSSTAYAFVIENTRVIFVASKLPTPSADHQYQLWLVRKDQPRYVAVGVFSPKDDGPVVANYDEDKEAINSLAGLLVTEEEISGTYTAPSSTKVLETPGAATIAGPAADAN